MSGKQVGHFYLSVSDPSPVWVDLAYRGGDVIRFNADELHDLEYAIQWAMRTAAGKNRKVPSGI